MLRKRLIDKILRLPTTQVSLRGGADPRAVIVRDTERLDLMTSGLLAVAIPSLISILVLWILLLGIAPLIGAVACVIGSVLFLLRRWSNHRNQLAIAEGHNVISTFDRGVAQTIRRHELAQSTASEDYERAERDRTSKSCASVPETRRDA